MNAGGKHQAPRKAAHALRKEVGQNIKDKMRDKRGVETHPREGVIKEKFPHSRKPSHRWVFREFWNLTGRGKKPTEDMPNCNCRKQNFLTKGSNLTA